MGNRGSGKGLAIAKQKIDTRDWSEGGNEIDGFLNITKNTGEGGVEDVFGGDTKGAFRDWYDTLTKTQKKDIERYSDDSSNFNTYMREEYAYGDNMENIGEDGYISMPQSRITQINSINNAMKKFTLDRGIIVNRTAGSAMLGGVEIGRERDKVNPTAEQINQMARDGAIVQDPAFTSTSIGSGEFVMAVPYAYNYHIKVPAGTHVAPITYWSGFDSGESEILLPHGGRYRVLGAYEKDGQTHINLEYVGRSEWVSSHDTAEWKKARKNIWGI